MAPRMGRWLNQPPNEDESRPLPLPLEDGPLPLAGALPLELGDEVGDLLLPAGEPDAGELVEGEEVGEEVGWLLFGDEPVGLPLLLSLLLLPDKDDDVGVALAAVTAMPAWLAELSPEHVLTERARALATQSLTAAAVAAAAAVAVLCATPDPGPTEEADAWVEVSA